MGVPSNNKRWKSCLKSWLLLFFCHTRNEKPNKPALHCVVCSVANYIYFILQIQHKQYDNILFQSYVLLNRRSFVYWSLVCSPMFLHSLWILVTVFSHYLHNALEKGSRFINQNSPLSSLAAGLPLYKGCNRFSCHCLSGGFCAPSGWDNGSC